MALSSNLRARLSTVGAKIASATLLVLAVVTAVAYFEVSRHERNSLLSAREDAADMVARLFAAGLVAPLSFGDDKGAQEQASLLTANDDVLYGAVWAADPDGLVPPRLVGQVQRAKPSATLEAPSLGSALRVRRDTDSVVVEAPVIDSSHHVLGVARVAFSLKKENAAIAATERRTLFGAAGFALGVAAVLLASIRTIIVRRLARLAAAAKRFQEGVPIDLDVGGLDEVGALARSFSSMAESIALREERITVRNRDLRCVLDNVAEGFLTVDCYGSMSDERSRILDEWFGPPARFGSFVDYIERIAPDAAPWIRLGWLQLNDDFVPVEVILDQLARRFENKGRSFELEFRAINAGATLVQVLVVVRDVTERIERERAEQSQREAVAIFRRIVADRAGFDELVSEASTLVEEIAGGACTDAIRIGRSIHTLKGIMGIFEIESVARFCHDLENRMTDDALLPTESERAQLRALWSAVKALRDQLDTTRRDRIEVAPDDYAQLLADLESGADTQVIASFVHSWRHERASARLERFRQQLHSVARRLGKPDVEIRTHVSPPELRLPSDRWTGVWTVFAHVLRNAIDHGVESADERRKTGKLGSGVISLSITSAEQGIEIAVVDDGRGIEWEAIRARAAALGLPAATPADLEEALFASAVSSRDIVTELSGRGVGMGAVREVVRGAGGSIAISSEAGTGTTMRLRFPTAMLTPSAQSFDSPSSACVEKAA